MTTTAPRERLLDAACTLMRTRSYGAVGVAEICAAADVRKGSFYHFFESKQRLTLAAIDTHWDRQRADWSLTLGSDMPPLDRLRRLFEETAAWQRATSITDGVVSGCALANLALELSTQDRVVQNRLREIFDEQIDLIEGVLREAAADNAIPDTMANRAVARAVIAQMEGMILFAKLGNDPAVLDDLWSQTLLLLGTGEMRSG